MTKSKLEDAEFGIIFHYDEHVARWDWLSKNPGKHKRDWPGRFEAVSVRGGGCAGCEYGVRLCERKNMVISACIFCPFKVDVEETCLNGLYSSWELATALERLDEASKLAEKIRDFPLRDDVIWEDVK